MTPLLRKFLGINWLLFAVMVGLLIFGVTAIYSASGLRSPELADKWRDQIIFATCGFIPFFLAALTDYKWVKWLGIPFYVVGLILLLITRAIGEDVYGTTGWIRFGGIGIQTSQVAIASGIILM
ncbi:MAG: FtsW/RodA/SpoVE family cell cycle protein, partial [Verrucomicrobiales bacterium]|nr:FtsW/RodA/SpoVE family cell cycle protein [Verrucomicrobiales bacterium]